MSLLNNTEPSVTLKQVVDALGGSIAIICDHDKCNTPIGALIGNALVLKNRHHGQIHTTVLNLYAYASTTLVQN